MHQETDRHGGFVHKYGFIDREKQRGRAIEKKTQKDGQTDRGIDRYTDEQRVMDNDKLTERQKNPPTERHTVVKSQEM